MKQKNALKTKKVIIKKLRPKSNLDKIKTDRKKEKKTEVRKRTQAGSKKLLGNL